MRVRIAPRCATPATSTYTPRLVARYLLHLQILTSIHYLKNYSLYFKFIFCECEFELCYLNYLFIYRIIVMKMSKINNIQGRDMFVD